MKWCIVGENHHKFGCVRAATNSTAVLPVQQPRGWIVAVGLQDARMGDTGGRLVLTGADPVMLQSLVEMGFPESDARRGLAARPNNLEVLSFSVPCSATS